MPRPYNRHHGTENYQVETNPTFRNADIKNSAKDLLAGRFHTAVMTFLFYAMLSLLFVRFSNALTQQVCVTLMQLSGLSADSSVILLLSYLIPLIVSILQNMIQMGVCLFFLNIACHHNCNTFDLLYGYSNQFGKTFCLSGVLTTLSFVALLPLNYFMDQFDNKLSIPMDTLVFLFAIQAVLLLIYFVLALSLSQVYYIALDHPELSVAQILLESIKIMKGQKLRLFLLNLSFLPLLLLMIPTLGVGLFWILPYLNMTQCLFFLHLMKADVAQSSYSSIKTDVTQ